MANSKARHVFLFSITGGPLLLYKQTIDIEKHTESMQEKYVIK